MQFILTGFTQDLAFRVFAFERMGLDRIRTKFVVKADLALVRRYGIQVQELPLLCRTLLDRSDDGGETAHSDLHGRRYEPARQGSRGRERSGRAEEKTATPDAQRKCGSCLARSPADSGGRGRAPDGARKVSMDKRLLKRHKRQVSRAKENVKLSEPDLRTPEQIKAAREASRATQGPGPGTHVHGSAASFRNRAATGTGSAAKTASRLKNRVSKLWRPHAVPIANPSSSEA